MKIKYTVFLLVLIFLIVNYMIYSKDAPIDSASGYNNSVFNQGIAEKLVTINCWFNDSKIVIDNDTDINSIYNELASLKLRKALPFTPAKTGSIIIELVTDDETISFGLLSGRVNINQKIYYTNKDITSSIREIAYHP